MSKPHTLPATYRVHQRWHSRLVLFGNAQSDQASILAPIVIPVVLTASKELPAVHGHERRRAGAALSHGHASGILLDRRGRAVLVVLVLTGKADFKRYIAVLVLHPCVLRDHNSRPDIKSRTAITSYELQDRTTPNVVDPAARRGRQTGTSTVTPEETPPRPCATIYTFYFPNMRRAARRVMSRHGNIPIRSRTSRRPATARFP